MRTLVTRDISSVRREEIFGRSSVAFAGNVGTAPRSVLVSDGERTT